VNRSGKLIIRLSGSHPAYAILLEVRPAIEGFMDGDRVYRFGSRSTLRPLDKPINL